jgi:carbamoyl-phosphate synthase large subunit
MGWVPMAKNLTKQEDLLYSLQNPSWNRLFHVYDAMKLGISMKTIQNLTKIDKWFLEQIWELIAVEKEIETFKLETIPADLMRKAKEKGYADRQIAHLLDCKESEVHKKRREMGINRVL